jgi:hypothetical protein
VLPVESDPQLAPERRRVTDRRRVERRAAPIPVLVERRKHAERRARAERAGSDAVSPDGLSPPCACSP